MVIVQNQMSVFVMLVGPDRIARNVLVNKIVPVLVQPQLAASALTQKTKKREYAKYKIILQSLQNIKKEALLTKNV